MLSTPEFLVPVGIEYRLRRAKCQFDDIKLPPCDQNQIPLVIIFNNAENNIHITRERIHDIFFTLYEQIKRPCAMKAFSNFNRIV